MAVSTHAEGEQDSAGPSEPRDEQGISEFVSHFGGLMAASGMPGLTGYVFALLLAQPDAELTAQQIGQALNVSPAAVSGATKYLADIGFTRRLRRPGSRRVVHALSSDDWYDALLGRSNVIEGSKRLFLEGSRAAGGVGTPAGRRLWLNAKWFTKLGDAIESEMAAWPAEREELLRSLGELDDADPHDGPAES